MHACMGMILSGVFLLTHHYCSVSTIHSPTNGQQCKVSPQYNVSAFNLVSPFKFRVEFFPQLGQTVPLDKYGNDRNNQMLQTLCCNVHKKQLH